MINEVVKDIKKEIDKIETADILNYFKDMIKQMIKDEEVRKKYYMQEYYETLDRNNNTIKNNDLYIKKLLLLIEECDNIQIALNKLLNKISNL